MITCEEALKKLYEVIDKEANEIDVRKVQEHLHSCKSCMSRYEFERMFKTFVVEKASSPRKTEDLRSKIMGRIDDLEKGGKGFTGDPFKFGMVIVAAAAALVICIVSAFSVAGFYRHKAQIYPFEKAYFAAMTHDNAVDGQVDFASSGFTQVTNDMHLTLNKNCPNFEFIDADSHEINGHMFSHMRCHCHGEYLSLFIGRAEGFSLPDFEREVVDGAEYFKHICDDCVMMYWYVGDAIVIAVTENKELDMSSVLTAVQPI